MKYFFILFILSFSVSSWGQIESEQTVALESKGMTAKKAKPYLLFKAINAALNQYSTELAFKPDDFKKNLDEKFEKYFEVYKERRLTAKFGKKYSSQLTLDQKKEFLNGLESHREAEYIKYSRLFSILDGHAFKQLVNEPKGSDTWMATVFLRINRGRLENLVKRMGSSQSKQYSSLNVMVEVTPVSLSWSDLGLEDEEDFTDPLLTSWAKWLETNQPSNVEEINPCTGMCLEEFEKWQQLPQDEGLVVEADQVNDLWLKISYNLRKLSSSSSLNEWRFQWEGRVVLLDANTKRILATHELSTEQKTVRGENQKTVNSILASSMYRSSLGALADFTKKIVDLPQLTRVSRLVIKGQNRLEDVLTLMKMLKKEGHSINLELQLDLFTKNEAQLLCFYQGEEKSFSDLLSRLKELKSSQSYRIVSELSGVHPVLKLVAE